MTPFFSVVIPTYARPRQLGDCLEGLAQLRYPRDRFEVIVVDDGSPDPPAAVVEQFAARLTVELVVQENAGPAAARNAGIARARGEFLAFTDDDCVPHPDWLAAYAARCGDGADRLLGGRTLNALPSNPYCATSQVIINVVYDHYNVQPGRAAFFASNNLAVPKAALQALGLFDPRFTTSEDRDLCDRWLQRGFPMAYVPDAMVYHAHLLTLRGFWQQHFGYGRGAFRYHRVRARRGAGGLRPDPRFYGALLAAPFCRVGRRHILSVAALLLLSQVANAAGFLFEWRLHGREW